MRSRILQWLGIRAGDQDGDDEESADSRFVPSVLDASVRYAHGGANTGAEREIAHLQAKGEELEELRREE
ncbi:hypothetical protein [Halorientalis halophila]|uniref:hypothetical protein n=1 Tax=Halorientalis halophila TaxID=3108499 RepID=UPI003009BEE5